MPAMGAPEPSPSRMKSRTVSTGVIPRSVVPLRQMFRCSPAIARTRRRRDREGEALAVAARRSAVADQTPAGGWVQPAFLIHLLWPAYSKNCERLLQTPGA